MRKGSKAVLAIAGIAAVATLYFVSLNVGPSQVQLFQGREELDLDFVNFIGKYQKQYRSKEDFNLRRQVFLTNLNRIRSHNEKNSSSYRMGVNRFSDMNEEEFRAMLGYKNFGQHGRKIDGENSFIIFNTTDLPKSVDWRPTGAVTKVKDQGSCGSCYAFSAVSSVEGAYFMKTNKTVELSVEQIVDCSDSYKNQGCGGGLPDWAFDYMWDNGLMTEQDNPYKGGRGSCDDDYSKFVVKLTHYYDVTHLDPDQLKGAVAQVGPISIGVGAGNDAWFHYNSGIIDDASVCKPNLDHAVLLVGYGAEAGREYWIVKNTWGDDWGEAGYVRILISPGFGVCGVNMTPIFPEVKILK